MGNPFGAENELLISKVKTLLITGKGPPLKEKIYLSLLLGVQDRESSHGCFPSRKKKLQHCDRSPFRSQCLAMHVSWNRPSGHTSFFNTDIFIYIHSVG